MADSLKKAQVQNPRDTRTFAEHYLEKLINVEVCVPAMTDLGGRVAHGLPQPGGPHARGAQDPRGAAEAERYHEAAKLASRWGTVLRATVALVLLFLSGYVSGRLLAPEETPPSLGTSSQPARAPADGGAPTGSGDTAATRTLPDAVGASPERPAERLPAVTSRQLEALWAVAPRRINLRCWRWCSSIGAGGLLMVLSTPRGVEIRDLPQFKQALRAWSGLLAQYLSTPRSMKRFVNQVRLYAMRQRAMNEDLPSLAQECIAAWLKAAHARKPLRARLHQVAVAFRGWVRSNGVPHAPRGDKELSDPLARHVGRAPGRSTRSFPWNEQSLGELLKKAVLPEGFQGSVEVRDAFTESGLRGIPHASEAATSFLAMALTLKSDAKPMR